MSGVAERLARFWKRIRAFFGRPGEGSVGPATRSADPLAGLRGEVSGLASLWSEVEAALLADGPTPRGRDRITEISLDVELLAEEVKGGPPPSGHPSSDLDHWREGILRRSTALIDLAGAARAAVNLRNRFRERARANEYLQGRLPDHLAPLLELATELTQDGAFLRASQFWREFHEALDRFVEEAQVGGHYREHARVVLEGVPAVDDRALAEERRVLEEAIAGAERPDSCYALEMMGLWRRSRAHQRRVKLLKAERAYRKVLAPELRALAVTVPELRDLLEVPQPRPESSAAAKVREFSFTLETPSPTISWQEGAAAVDALLRHDLGYGALKKAR